MGSLFLEIAKFVSHPFRENSRKEISLDTLARSVWQYPFGTIDQQLLDKVDQ
jgi:hypothetical protein